MAGESGDGRWASARFGFRVTWGPPWELGEAFAEPEAEGVRLVVGRLVHQYLGFDTAETDPAAVLAAFVARFRADRPGLKVVRPWSGTIRNPVGMEVEYDGPDGTRVYEELHTAPIDDRGWVVGIYVRHGFRLAGHSWIELTDLDRAIHLERLTKRPVA